VAVKAEENISSKGTLSCTKGISKGIPVALGGLFSEFFLKKILSISNFERVINFWYSFGHYNVLFPHNQLEDQCQRYLSAYADMVREVDAIDDFAEVVSYFLLLNKKFLLN